MAQAENQPSVDWLAYFQKIKHECPWSLAAYERGPLDIRPWQGQALPLEHYHARMYTVDLEPEELQQLAASLDEGPCEWLWSHPGYGPWATPVSVLIQQDRKTLNELRNRLEDKLCQS